MQNVAGFDLSTLVASAEGLLLVWGARVLGAVVVLLAGWAVAAAVRRSLGRAFRRTRLDKTLEMFLTRLVYWGIILVVVLGVLGLFGIETTSLVAVLGAAGFAVGLAMQGTLSNFSAGVMLIVFRPFKVGDYVEVAGVSGTVVDVGIFTTLLDTPDNVRIIVPNSEIYGQILKNYAANPTRRLDLVMGVSYSDDLGRAAEVMRRVLDDDERVLPDPGPVVAVNELGDSSVNFVVRPWCRREDYWELRWDLHRRLKEELESAGCEIPFPQRDVHLYRTSETAA